MILVFGGTTEGKQVISTLGALGLDFVYSTKTRIETELPSNACYRYGAMTEEILTEFIEEHKIEIIVNAAHPFATELHLTIAKVQIVKGFKVLRLDRVYPKRLAHYLIRYVHNYEEALDILESDFNGRKGLMLTGVQSIPKLKPFWMRNQCYFRILNRLTSIEIADKAGFPKKQLILEEVKALIGGEEELIDRLKLDFMLTKESGKTGALHQKMEIAIKKNIPLMIIKRPILPDSFQTIKNIEEQ